jgi:hypothetical protein
VTCIVISGELGAADTSKAFYLRTSLGISLMRIWSDSMLGTGGREGSKPVTYALILNSRASRPFVVSHSRIFTAWGNSGVILIVVDPSPR